MIRDNLRTKSVDGLREHHEGSHANEESLRFRVHLDHPVEDGNEYGRRQDEGGEVGELLGDEVHIGAIRAVEVLSQEDLGGHSIGKISAWCPLNIFLKFSDMNLKPFKFLYRIGSRKLQAERVYHGEHVLEGHVDDDQDEDAVDVRHRFRCNGILVKVDESEENCGELENEIKTCQF